MTINAETYEQVMEQPAKAKSKANPNPNPDLFMATASKVEALTKTKALNEADRLASNIEQNYLEMGGVLKVIYENSWFEGFESFGMFVFERFGFQERKAKYLMEIYAELVTKQIPWVKVAGLGWTKLKDLAKVLTVENVDEWVAKAANVTVVELQAMLKASPTPQADGSTATKDSVTPLKFKLKPDQLETITSALNKCKAEVHTEYDDVALEMLCAGYLGGSVSTKPSTPAPGVDSASLMKSAGWETTLNLFGELFPDIEITATV